MSFSRRVLIAWTLAVGLAAAAVGLLAYRTGDPDSELYSRIAANLASKPVSEWLCPTWPEGSYRQGFFVDHPAGIFVLPAVLARFGFPAEDASYAMGLVYSGAIFAVLPSVVCVFAKEESLPLASLLQVLPIFFVFRIRANHEPAVALFFLLALLGAERVARRQGDGLPVVVLALVAILLVKGLFVIPVMLCSWLWLAVRSFGSSSPRPSWVVVFLASGASLVAVAAAYELSYRHLTGQSFLLGYTRLSFSLGASRGHPFSSWTFPYNLLFYVGRILWFAFPWSLVLLAAAISRLLKPMTPRPRAELSLEAQGAVFTLGASLIYLFLFGLSGRRAERYIFPVYLVVGACGATLALRRWPVLMRFGERIASLGPVAPPVLWLILVGLHLVSGSLDLPRVQLWRP